MDESLKRANLAKLRAGDRVNLGQIANPIGQEQGHMVANMQRDPSRQIGPALRGRSRNNRQEANCERQGTQHDCCHVEGFVTAAFHDGIPHRV